MGETLRVRCDGCGAEISVRITGGRGISAVQRAARIDAVLGEAGWSTTGLTDFCPDCIDTDPAPTAETRPHLTIVRDQPPA